MLSSQTVEVGTPAQSRSIQSSPCHSEVSVASTAAAATSGLDYAANFKIPSRWRPSVMKAIEDKKLTPDVCNEIVRDLVTYMYGYMELYSSTIACMGWQLNVMSLPDSYFGML